MRETEVLLLDTWAPGTDIRGFRAVLLRSAPVDPSGLPPNAIVLPDNLRHLDHEDVVRISTQNRSLSVLYRRKAVMNSLLVTDRCNHLCIMCSQPPKTADDSYIIDELLAAIPLFAPDTAEIMFTGGEPTIAGPRFFELVRAMRNYLPRTSLHILSNGRSFKDETFAQRLADVHHPDLMMGIPLYAPTSELHEYIVQSHGAFDETVRGILNLKRAGVRVELRVVIQRSNFEQLPALAEFIARNLVFLDHVALMGIEPIGYAKANLDTVWIDPVDYQVQLKRSVRTLSKARMKVSIYNHQLCTLERDLWSYATQSISDWKNEYLDACGACAVRHRCGGFFSSGVPVHSRNIAALAE
jgi:His-Xaa-Ser system radical SAM maturase HxsC